jgi:hypothetical protein
MTGRVPAVLLSCAVALVLGGCADRAAKALVEARSARTVAAETAAVLQQQSQGRVSATYARSVRKLARRELMDLARKAARDAPPVRAACDQALMAINLGDPAGLARATGILIQLEAAYGRDR